MYARVRREGAQPITRFLDALPGQVAGAGTYKVSFDAATGAPSSTYFSSGHCCDNYWGYTITQLHRLP